jgi:hypothetical protein
MAHVPTPHYDAARGNYSTAPSSGAAFYINAHVLDLS